MGVQILSSETRVARKAHFCNYCGLEIPKGERYSIDGVKGDGLYTWKSHTTCGKLATELQWFDNYDEGLTHESFQESVNEEYNSIMSNFFNYIYESKEFNIPSFGERLRFIKEHHNIFSR